MQITSVVSPKYIQPDNSVIDCLIGIDGAAASIPFTCRAGAPEQHEADLYQALVAGSHGPIQAYQPPALADAKAQRKAEINQWRLAAEQAGFSFVFPDGETGTVQTRERDMVNIVGLAMGAQVTPGATFHFRDAEDVTHVMTAAEVVALGNAAQAFITGNYQQAWILKDQVDQATTVAEVEAITWGS